MARKDILIDIDSGGFLVNNINGSTEAPTAVELNREEGMLDKHLYFEVVLEYGGEINTNVHIPYTPVDSIGYIRVGVKDSFGIVSYVRNPYNNTMWYQISYENEPISLSKLAMVSNIGRFTTQYNPENGVLNFYSMDEVDFAVNESAYQDAMLIIKANKGGILRHPTSGVEIFKYLHSTTGRNRLGDVVHRELLDDGIITNEARLDDRGNLELDITEENRGYEEKQ